MRLHTIITKNKKTNTEFKKLQKNKVNIHKIQKNNVSFTKKVYKKINAEWEII
jgi:hypothetical protein